MAPVAFMPTAETEENRVRECFVREEEERPKVAYNEFSEDIPVISLEGIEGGEDFRSVIRRKIVEACEEWGIFQVIDHGVDNGLIEDMMRFCREFFELSAEEKMRFHTSDGKKSGFIVASHLQGEVVMDWRELFIYISYPIRNRDYSRWPDKPEGWRAVVDEYSTKLMKLACNLLGLLSEAMGLDREALAQACIEMDQKLVINFYPKCPQPDLTLGLRRHTDPGTITILLQDQVGGLQATKDGGKTWITVQPVENAFVVNLGDHGHYLSNGRFKNADHQAVVNSNCSRVSIATFQYPAPDAMVYPLVLREGESPVLNEPIRFLDMYRRKMGRDQEHEESKKITKQENGTTIEKH